MADENKDPQVETPIKPENQGVETPSKDSAPSDNEWKSIAGDKYATPSELAKAHKELEKKLGELGEEAKQGKDFATAVAPILDAVKNDPELFKILDEKLRKSETTPSKNESDYEVKEVKSVASDLILARFEEQNGIDKLEPDEAKRLRGEIGTIVTELTGQNMNSVDLRRLPMILGRAFTLATAGKSKPENSDDGALPPMSSSNGKKEATISQEELSVAAKMGLTKEQYLEGKKR